LALRIFFALVTDNVTYGGYRRRSAMFLGWFIATLSVVVLMILSNTQVTTGASPPRDAPSLPLLGSCIFFYAMGVNFATVVADGMAAEKYQLEGKTKGTFLTSCLVLRFFGEFIAATSSTFLYSGAGSIGVFAFMALFPSSILFLIMYLEEDVSVKDVPGFKKNLATLWEVLQTRAAWQSMGFFFIFSSIRLENSTFWGFLELTLRFTETQINMVAAFAVFAALGGVITYKYCFMFWSWKILYCSTTVMSFFGCLFQILQVQGFTFSISQFIFAFFSQGYLAYIDGIQLVPIFLIIACLCPKGGEATAFALFLSIENLATFVNHSIVKMLERYYSITEATLLDPVLARSGVTKLTITVGSLSLLSMLSLQLMPHNYQELDRWKKTTWRPGGFLVIAMVCLGLAYTTLYAIVILTI
jgi:hypothetical protein